MNFASGWIRFEYFYEEGKQESACIDVNECNVGVDKCDENALCFNEPGGYQCRCKAGYNGDGFTCQSRCCIFNFFVVFLMLPRVVQKRLRAREFDVPPSRNVMRHQKVTLSAAVCLDIKKSITNRVVDQMVNLLLLKTPIAAKRIDVISMLIVFTVANKTDIAVSV